MAAILRPAPFAQLSRARRTSAEDASLAARRGAKRPTSTKARDAYLQMLSSGGSDFPVELLKRAGVDMTTSAPFQAAMADMNETMDQMEAVLGRQAKGEGK